MMAIFQAYNFIGQILPFMLQYTQISPYFERLSKNK